ncbi:MAG: TIGR01620 family protein [Geminicoccaceae bacterium]
MSKDQGGRKPILPFELEVDAENVKTLPVASEPPKARTETTSRSGDGKGWTGKLAAAFFAAITGLVGLESIRHVSAMIETTPLIGWPFLVLLLIVGATAMIFLGREIWDMRAMREGGRLREAADRLKESDLHGEAGPLIARIAHRLGARDGLARFEQARTDQHSDGEQLAIFERHAVAPLDKRAYRLVLEGSRDIGLLTALSPLGLLDGFLVIWRTLVMIRQIARLYGLHMGPAASLSLLRQCLRNAAIAGVADVVSHATIEHVGASITAMLSARAGQGAGNALLAARLGLEAIRQARPLPYIREEQPRLKHVREAIFVKGEIRIDEPEKTPA